MNIFDELKDKPEGVYVRFQMKLVEMQDADAPDQNDEGFWPSLDRDAAGWIGDNPEKDFDTQMREARERYTAWENGDWNYIGVKAKALIFLKTGACVINYGPLESSGLWGIESDADEYHAEVYAEQREELEALFEGMRGVTYLG